MKKTYAKPEIQFESFSVSNSIAANCGTINKSFGENACAYITVYGDKLIHVFTDELTSCTTKEADGDYNGVCYHVPSDAYGLFTS